MRTIRCRFRFSLMALTAAGLLGTMPASAQDAAAKFSTWTKVEGAVDTR